MKMVKDICPSCEKVTDLERVQRQEAINVRGELIEVEDQFFHCLECGEEFEDPKSMYDVFSLAYRKYRHMHGMLQPEEIRAWRGKYSLTQKELSSLLSWGGATLSRYEQGGLQDDAHEKMLRLIMDPYNFLNLVKENDLAILEDKKGELTRTLNAEIEKKFSLFKILSERFGNYSADQLSGNRLLDINKLLSVIRFFCHESGQFITKINKLLFYVDFKHFKEYSLSITGSRYVKITYGPVPKNYQFYIAFLESNKLIFIKEVFFDNGNSGEEIISIEKPDLSIFSDTELQILLEVKKYFKGFSAKKISDFSHEEIGYIETKNSNAISYLHAKSLKI
jgi:putative zinc finger/helix-turn-helix YgiT family protein